MYCLLLPAAHLPLKESLYRKALQDRQRKPLSRRKSRKKKRPQNRNRQKNLRLRRRLQHLSQHRKPQSRPSKFRQLIRQAVLINSAQILTRSLILCPEDYPVFCLWPLQAVMKISIMSTQRRSPIFLRNSLRSIRQKQPPIPTVLKVLRRSPTVKWNSLRR